MNIITFYNDKINKEFPILQKKVFQKYKHQMACFPRTKRRVLTAPDKFRLF